jgi:uncharacterized repeat protein (TIGR03803 family)
MKSNLHSQLARLIFIAVIAIAFTTTAAAGVKERVLYNFSGNDGKLPESALIFDSAGNLYGTTFEGGTGDHSLCQQGCGVVFELSRTSHGVKQTVLYNFCSLADCSDGANPAAGLILDAAGNLYGTTTGGGNQNVACPGTAGCGTVFELMRNSDDSWTEVVLYRFSNTDGAAPEAGLTFDCAGNLYGTTSQGGAEGFGVVFELTPAGENSWTQSVLHSFTGGTDGNEPYAGVVLDSAGNLYGTTYRGGTQAGICATVNGCGVVFKLALSDGTWTETVLHAFKGGDGADITSGLTFDASGNLYGTAYLGGSSHKCGLQGCGLAFELTPNVDGSWKETVLHTFISGATGAHPTGSLVFDSAGNLYATARGGGSVLEGVIFELTPTGTGNWKEQALSFTGANGSGPDSGVILDSAGNVYGTTSFGGANGDGMVFQFTR